MNRTLKVGEEISRRLWLAALKNGGPHPKPDSWAHVPSVFLPEWLATLELPIDESVNSDQTVALVRGNDFDRSATGVEVAVAYSNDPRTRVYESAGARSGGWLAAVDTLLAKSFRYEVVSSVYVSNAGDANMGLHRDEWYGIIVQLDGTKEWTVLDAEDVATSFTLETGDVLLLPRDVRHEVETPHHSAHVAFAVMTSEPLATLVS